MTVPSLPDDPAPSIFSYINIRFIGGHIGEVDRGQIDSAIPCKRTGANEELFFPEERRHEFTAEPWDGVSFRHYRNPKLVCLEHYRRENAHLSGIGRRPAA